MFSVEASPRFDDAYALIMRDLYYYFGEAALDGFDGAFDSAMANVRLFPESYRATSKGARRFYFEFKTIPFTAFFTVEADTILLHDIDYSRSARVSHMLQ